MKIKKIISHNKGYLRAIYQCEHCGFEKMDYGFKETYFHEHVVPGIPCQKCGKKADGSYVALATKYPDEPQI